MNRRAFLALCSAGAAGMAVDPERLLWVAGAKTIMLPPVGGWPDIYRATYAPWQSHATTDPARVQAQMRAFHAACRASFEACTA